LQALSAHAVRLDNGAIEVEHGWHYKESRIATKGKTNRKVPIASALREPLAAELLATGRREGELIFGETPSTPFSRQSLQKRADAAWTKAKLTRVTPHDCRHAFASLMIAAGCNVKALSTYMGHANISITLDRYGHLMPGNEAEAAELLDAYLTRWIKATG
jgi:integrase